ncbi:MAG: ClbS/DfsB family four-helix bundle protein [Dehalococcoidia bacterium]
MSDKTSALQELDKEYKALRTLVDDLDDAALTRVWYGGWSIKDVIAHVLGWEREMTGALQRIARGERPAAEGVDYSNPDAWNETFSQAMKPIDSNTVLAAWGQTHMTYVKAAKAVGEDRYGASDDGKPKTANRLLEASGTGHYREHAEAIREWRKREGL